MQISKKQHSPTKFGECFVFFDQQEPPNPIFHPPIKAHNQMYKLPRTVPPRRNRRLDLACSALSLKAAFSGVYVCARPCAMNREVVAKTHRSKKVMLWLRPRNTYHLPDTCICRCGLQCQQRSYVDQDVEVLSRCLVDILGQAASRKGFCRNLRGIFPNKVLGKFCEGLFGGFSRAIFLGKKEENPHQNPDKFKSEFGSFAAKIHAARIWP